MLALVLGALVFPTVMAEECRYTCQVIKKHVPGGEKKLARLKNTCQVIKKNMYHVGKKTFQVKKHLSGELIQYWSFKN